MFNAHEFDKCSKNCEVWNRLPVVTRARRKSKAAAVDWLFIVDLIGKC